MPRYEYECEVHGLREVVKPMMQASDPELCHECFSEVRLANWGSGYVGVLMAVEAATMKRIYSAQAIIMRPDGWSLKPGDKGYWNFDRQRELGQLRDGGTAADKRRLDASLFERPPAPKPVYSDSQMRNIRNFSEIVDREIRQSADIPELWRSDADIPESMR